MSESGADVGGLTLPESLLHAIDGGRWKPPGDVQLLREVFADEPDWPQFYDVATMVRQNQKFQKKSASELEDQVPGSSLGLGIEPGLAVLIGSLGADMPIALDYRSERENPRVIYLAEDGWHEVAPTFEELGRRLSL